MLQEIYIQMSVPSDFSGKTARILVLQGDSLLFDRGLLIVWFDLGSLIVLV